MRIEEANMKTKFEIIEISQTNVTVDVSCLYQDEMFFNATEIAKKYAKTPKDWLRTKDTEDYINVVSREENMPNENLVKIKQGGKYQGTWLHKTLAIEFARWCDKEFAYRLDKWIIQRLKEESERKRIRYELKTGYLPMTDAVRLNHNPAKFYHYSNEANLICRVMFGISSKEYKKNYDVENIRDNLSMNEIKNMDALQRANTTFLEMGMDYDLRKENLKIIKSRKERMLV